MDNKHLKMHLVYSTILTLNSKLKPKLSSKNLTLAYTKDD
jgi:hypothetical protein